MRDINIDPRVSPELDVKNECLKDFYSNALDLDPDSLYDHHLKVERGLGKLSNSQDPEISNYAQRALATFNGAFATAKTYRDMLEPLNSAQEKLDSLSQKCFERTRELFKQPSTTHDSTVPAEETAALDEQPPSFVRRNSGKIGAATGAVVGGG